jgi:transposase-like protein
MSNGSPADGDPQPDRSYRNREYLHEEYVERRRSQQDIAEEWDVSQGTIQYWIERHGIERKLLFVEHITQILRETAADDGGYAPTTEKLRKRVINPKYGFGRI